MNHSTLKAIYLVFLFLLPGIRGYSQEALSLKECINYALNNNLQVQQALLNVSQNNLTLRQSRLSLLPTLNGNVNQGFNYGRTIDPFTNDFISQQINTSSISLSSSILLFGGFRLQNDIKRNRSYFQASLDGKERVKNEVAMEVAGLYLQVLMNREQVKAVMSQLELSRERLDQIKILVEGGRENRFKQLEIEAQLISDEAILTEANNRLELSLLQLKQSINWPSDKEFDIISPELPDLPTVEDIPSIEDVVENNFQRLPQVSEAENELEGSYYETKQAGGNRLPSLSAGASINTGYSSQAKTVDGYFLFPDTLGYVLSNGEPVISDRLVPRVVQQPFGDQINSNFGQVVSLRLSIPIFNNYSASTNYQLSKIRSSMAQIRLEQVKRNVRNSIYEAWLNLRNAASRIESTEKQLETRKQLFDQADLQFNAGAISYFEWQSAKNMSLQAETDFLNAKYQYYLQRMIFDFYLGKPLDFKN